MKLAMDNGIRSIDFPSISTEYIVFLLSWRQRLRYIQ
ncbi:MAG: hypothetical protein ACLTGR_07495 [Eubacterium sp.]